MNPVFKATIQKGKVIFDRVDMFNSYVVGLEGKEVNIVISKRKKHRTNPQNSWYWACVVAIPAEHFGYTPDEMHEAFKWMFLRKHIEDNRPLTVVSTASLSTVEFSEYVEKCRQFCAEEGLYIPDPEEVDISGKYERTETEKSEPVSIETLAQIFSWTGKGGLTEEKIIEISIREFGKEPRELTQDNAEKLDTLILAEIENL